MAIAPPPRLFAALSFAERGWPVLPIKPRSKEPLTPHGVQDATVDRKTIERWFKKWPNANVGIACGTPGPDVLDIDDLVLGAHALKLAVDLGGPDVATARGRQFYFHGTAQRTVALGFGEVRRVGSYVVAPPSWHPEGVQYTWITEPSGLALPRLPDGIVPEAATTAGAGAMEIPAERIPHGQRDPAIKDYCIRLIRAGILDPDEIEANLRSFYERRCELEPKPTRNYFRNKAKWAVDQSRIAARERTFAERAAGTEAEPESRAKKGSGLEIQPKAGASRDDHKDYLRLAGGWPKGVDIENVVRYGQGSGDALHIKLTDGKLIQFPKQGEISGKVWTRTVLACTNGEAQPKLPKEPEAMHIYRSLCVLASPLASMPEAEIVADLIRTMIAACEVWTNHHLSTPEGRYEAITNCNSRGVWTTRSPDDKPPVLIVDYSDLRLYLRAREVHNWLVQGGLKIDAAGVPGRMAMIGAEHLELRGREGQTIQGRPRDSRKLVFYRLPEDWTR